jgi:hypothetical protein
MKLLTPILPLSNCVIELHMKLQAHEYYAGIKPENFVAMQDFIAGHSSKPVKSTSKLWDLYFGMLNSGTWVKIWNRSSKMLNWFWHFEQGYHLFEESLRSIATVFCKCKIYTHSGQLSAQDWTHAKRLNCSMFSFVNNLCIL